MLTYSFENRGANSLYSHLYQCIRHDIERGSIAAGARLPSKRALARHLGVSLITIESAYSQLIAEGYVDTQERRGYYALPIAAPPRPPAPSCYPHVVATSPSAASDPSSPSLSTGAVAGDLFPFTTWTRVLREVISRESEGVLMSESPAAGVLCLREALAEHLRAFRGLEADPEHIVVGAGAQTLYNLIVQLLGRANRFAVEDPGYSRLTRVYESNDVSVALVPVDGRGIQMRALRASGATVAHLMPSHQFPTGIVTSAGRRHELLAWASERPGRYLIEDDYDCEFRLTGRPIPTMRSIDAPGRVIYANTFSRSLGPAFRVGYLVLPSELAERYTRDLGFYSCTVSTVEQLALARFISRGDFERHVNRLRCRYRVLRAELMAALSSGPLAARLVVEGAEGGLRFLLGIASAASEEAICAAAREEGVPLRPLSAFRMGASSPSAQLVWHELFGSQPAGTPLLPFVVDYAGIPVESVRPCARALERAIKRADRIDALGCGHARSVPLTGSNRSFT